MVFIELYCVPCRHGASRVIMIICIDRRGQDFGDMLMQLWGRYGRDGTVG